ncbi:dye-decolorizing peroxidase YfeX-like isoform X2 [Tubulanus polymorphus]|uniref:dye-decolorizing peroxidase YfeX-like isoform X2 n=1 Tax=Tubulanus polymorphus TaxID=672921 RepID=UPI003DA530A0
MEVYSETKKHAVYIWIHLNSNANVQTCAKIAANLQRYVDHVVPPKDRDDEEEILAGVGFGPDFYRKVAGKTEKEFNYAHRKGALGDLPSTGGDIFIHAKSDTYSNLFELTQIILKQFPPGAVKQFEDVYSFVYKNGRDLSGFIDGTENPADEEHRQSVTVEKSTGASYVITQKWIHQFDVINSAGDKMEQWVGRSKPDSIELRRKSITSHLGRMTGGNNFEQKKRFEIVRQSMPYGSLSGEAGLFFIAYAESPENFDYMLDRMVGSGADGGHCDDVMRLTKCVTGSYWYFPSKNDLKKLQ